MKIKLRLFQNLLAISLLFSGSTLHAQNNFNEMLSTVCHSETEKKPLSSVIHTDKAQLVGNYD